jgi:glycosyltransferase involved in cell wall biosynthesis
VFSPGPEKLEVESEGFPVHEIHISRRISPTSDVVSLNALTRYFREARPSIVHTHNSKAGVAGSVAAGRAGVPAVIRTVHGFPFSEEISPAKALLYQGLERWAARYDNAILSQSQEDVITAAKLRIRSREGGLVFIGNGVDLNKFNPARFGPAEKTAIRLSLGIGPDALVLLCVARLTQAKGLDDLINAMPFVLRELSPTPVVLLIAGEDEGSETSLRTMSARLGLDGGVRFLGPRTDVPELMAAADLYTLPSYIEGMPRSVIEAQAMGLPAVVTDVRGCREIVVDGETGLVVPPRAPHELAEAIVVSLLDIELRQKLGAAARLRAEVQYDETTVFCRIRDVYERLSPSRGSQSGAEGDSQCAATAPRAYLG